MTYKSFEDLPAWQAASALYNRVLDLLQDHPKRFSPGYRNQLDRAALSVSNNIAEGFERTTTAELLHFLGIARGSAGEVRSMIAVIQLRPEMQPIRSQLQLIFDHACDCIKQIMGWTQYLENSDVQGKRHLTPERKHELQTKNGARNIRLLFLRSLSPEHPLYHTEEAKAARQNPDEPPPHP